MRTVVQPTNGVQVGLKEDCDGDGDCGTVTLDMQHTVEYGMPTKAEIEVQLETLLKKSWKADGSVANIELTNEN